MSSDLRRFHAARIRTDYAALLEVQDTLAETVARRAEAQRVLDAVSREAAALEELQETLAARLAASRYDSLQLCVATLPEDILGCIFEEVCRDNGLGDTTSPFTLTAVCSQWRRVALALASLWTVIQVIVGQEEGLARLKAYASSVALHLARSHAAPLEISVIWFPPDPFQHNRAEMIQEFTSIMDALGRQVSRWRTAVVLLPDLPEMAGLSAIECLKGATPQLIFMVLSTGAIASQSRATSGQGFLPYAPVLQSIMLREGGFPLSSRSHFPSLTDLDLPEGTCTDEELYDYLIRAPSLTDLVVDIPVARASSVKITLPELQTLKIGPCSRSLLFEPISTFLCLPKLTHLTLDCAPDDALTPFLDMVSPTVRNLHLGHRLQATHIASLRHLQCIEELHLESWPGKTIDGSVLAQLVSDQPPIWPRLTTLEGVRYVSGMADRLLGLIAARNPPLESGENETDALGRPRRMRTIKFRYDGSAPEWLVQEMDRLLRL